MVALSCDVIGRIIYLLNLLNIIIVSCFGQKC